MQMNQTMNQNLTRVFVKGKNLLIMLIFLMNLKCRFLLQFLFKNPEYKINEICIHSAHYFSIIIYWLEISFWCTSRKAAFEWFIPDLVASMHKIFVIEMDMAKRLGSKGAVVANQYKPCCHQQFFLEKKYWLQILP